MWPDDRQVLIDPTVDIASTIEGHPVIIGAQGSSILEGLPRDVLGAISELARSPVSWGMLRAELSKRCAGLPTDELLEALAPLLLVTEEEARSRRPSWLRVERPAEPISVAGDGPLARELARAYGLDPIPIENLQQGGAGLALVVLDGCTLGRCFEEERRVRASQISALFIVPTARGIVLGPRLERGQGEPLAAVLEETVFPGLGPLATHPDTERLRTAAVGAPGGAWLERLIDEVSLRLGCPKGSADPGIALVNEPATGRRGRHSYDASRFVWREDDLASLEVLNRPGKEGFEDARVPMLASALAERGSDRFQHSVGTFRDHLLGTGRILRGWRQRSEICRAGMFHSAYSTQFFREHLFAPWERETVRELIGETAEALVFLFCTVDRFRLTAEVAKRHTLDGGLILHNLHTEQQQRFSPRVVAALLVVEMANLAEQVAYRDRAPGLWMSKVSHFGRVIRSHLYAVPPVFDHCSAVLTPEEEKAALATYAQAHTGAPGEEKHLRETVALNPWVGEPHIRLVRLCAARGEHLKAEGHARRGAALLTAWGTPWDKSLHLDQWLVAAAASAG
ncbi:hypothetical protein D187_010330 [Cystobacter fuscus DSM 2262]|uniref:DUF6817 domain-containing protein n=1 Tax=Cystobacter fuscus (strain ATCC 25194 / DSM 2262 / NBRC 100088 / M29) TaxID=1242864 RepID=S9PF93_CYSF2|nr:hypothetical protein [Cystobacter fuscus]EPX61711.1 hypothetical protein D187_010330 [Cystobacter fuscus DSM 2262]